MNHGGLGLQLLVEIFVKKVIGFHQSGNCWKLKGDKISESIFIFVPFEEKMYEITVHQKNMTDVD